MGDPKRFSRFAELIEKAHPIRDVRIADVAGGKGHLQAALRGLGYEDIVSFDKRPRMAKQHRQRYYRYEWFSFNRHRKEFGLVAAMHPDQGTDHSVLYAVNNRVPFVVCPCCILPSATSFWHRKDFGQWVKHLEVLAAETHDVRRVELPISGKNLCLVGTPKPRQETEE